MRPSICWRPAKSAVAVPSTGFRSGGTGSLCRTVVMLTRIGMPRPNGSRRRLLWIPPATTQPAQPTRSRSVRTATTRPDAVSIDDASSPIRNSAPCRSAAARNANTVASGSACPSVGQWDAARTASESAGATARTASPDGRNARSSPAFRCSSTMRRIWATSSSSRASRRLPSCRYPVGASNSSSRSGQSATAPIAIGSSATSRPDCRTPASVHPDAMAAGR